jgi:hypothetical protein
MRRCSNGGVSADCVFVVHDTVLSGRNTSITTFHRIRMFPLSG